jgi:hypothetical protein
VDFHATPAEELLEKKVTINVDAVYGQFAAIETYSQRRGKYSAWTDTTYRLYYVIKTSDRKIMAMAIKPELKDEVDLRCKRTMQGAQGVVSANNMEPLQLRGMVYEMNEGLRPGGYAVTSQNPSTPPLTLFTDYVFQAKSIAAIEQELKGAEVFPHVLSITARSYGGFVDRLRDLDIVIALCTLVTLFGSVALLIWPFISFSRDKRFSDP